MGSPYQLPPVDPLTIPTSWRKTPPPPSNGRPVQVYRGFARNVQRHAMQVVAPQSIAAGGILSRDPAAAHDAVFNQKGRTPVLSGPQQGGVVELTIPPDLWDLLIQTINISERDGYPGFAFPYRLSTTEIRVNTLQAGRYINQCKRQILQPDARYDYR